jgi:hypothetical protein
LSPPTCLLLGLERDIPQKTDGANAWVFIPHRIKNPVLPLRSPLRDWDQEVIFIGPKIMALR